MNKKGIDFDMGAGGSVDIPFGKNWDFNLWYKQGQKGGPAPSDYNFGVKIKRAIQERYMGGIKQWFANRYKTSEPQINRIMDQIGQVVVL